MKYSIGTTYEGKNFDYLNQILPYVNHIEISPDSVATNGSPQHIHLQALEHLKWIEQNNISLLIHGVGLSIGSYDGYSVEYLNLLNELFNSLNNIVWHSEHLAYTMVDAKHLGTMLSLPRTNEVIDMICRRVDSIQKKYKVPFLLENVISMLPDKESEYSEAAFLNKITHLTGCRLILDVYNLECDEANFNLNISDFLEELNFSSIGEMHLAGGVTDDEFNFKMDVHSQLLADSTVELAKIIATRNPPYLHAITFEILEEFIPKHGIQKIITELKKLYSIFNAPNEFTAVANRLVHAN